MLVFADKDGDENFQIFKVDPDEGWQTPLVMRSGVRNTFGIECISPNGRLAAYSSNERAPQDLDLVTTRLPSGETNHVLADGGTYMFGYWSPDGAYATAIEVLSTDDYNVLLLNMKTGQKKNLTPHTERAVYAPGPWSPEGEGILVLSSEGREFVGLGYLPAKEGMHIKWLKTPEGDIDDVTLSPDGRTLALVVNQDGYSAIHFMNHQTGRSLASVKLGGVLSAGGGDNNKLTKFSPDGKRLICLLSTPTRPMEIHTLRTPGFKMEMCTDGFIGNVPVRMMVRPKLIAFTSVDRKIPAFLYRPKTERARSFPALISIHGGPEAQERPTYAYAGMYQYLLSKGIAVLAPNIRGSTGYGKGYQRLIHRDWGGSELKDIEYAVKYLRGFDWVDTERIGVFGGSFGGFATLSAATRLPEYWRVAVDICGPSNLVTFANSVPEFWKRFMADLLGDPEKESDYLLSRSPVTCVENLKCPILIIQGAKDPRVAKAESDQIVERLTSKGQEVEYIIFPDEGHGFTKRKNEFAAWKQAAEFLTNHLLD